MNDCVAASLRFLPTRPPTSNDVFNFHKPPPFGQTACQSASLDPLPSSLPPSSPRMPLFCGEDAPLLPEAEQPAAVSPADGQRNRSLSPDNGSISLTTLDGRPISRGEVIQRLKRGESPSWSLNFSPQPSPRPTPRQSPQPALLPSPSLNEPEDGTAYNAGLEIERPRSALHSGDFHDKKRAKIQHETLGGSLSPPAPWRSPFFSSPIYRDEYPSRPAASPPNQHFLPPTSPLFHAHTNRDVDMTDRRNPFSREMAQTAPTTPPRYLSSHPFRAHQPRQSISIPPTPGRPRGISVSSDASPLHQSPLVGSYEESILRGRMSTTPSKPLDFIAQIGVLGYGKCKPSLQCPRHVTVSFPAVFYSYASSGPALDNQPSPYVGLIDVEHSFPPYDARGPPGGCYRIPRQGQLQIILKNPNKTAVKLFLVPYDLRDMQPGQKTFIRQRSYSTGPIIDMPLAESKISSSETPTLRYLIHLHICCTSRGRYFLYKSIRVVFANRVPDGKEHLRNEVQYPEPKYAPYKPSRDSGPAGQKAMAAALEAREKAARRRSTPFHFGICNMDAVDGIGDTGPGFELPRMSFPFAPVDNSLSRLESRLSMREQVGPADGIPLGVGELARSGEDREMSEGPREASFQLR